MTWRDGTRNSPCFAQLGFPQTDNSAQEPPREPPTVERFTVYLSTPPVLPNSSPAHNSTALRPRTHMPPCAPHHCLDDTRANDCCRQRHSDTLVPLKCDEITRSPS